jgi:hypothetical protein
MMSVVNGPIRSLSDWWSSIKTKKTATATQRLPDFVRGLSVMGPPTKEALHSPALRRTTIELAGLYSPAPTFGDHA